MKVGDTPNTDQEKVSYTEVQVKAKIWDYTRPYIAIQLTTTNELEDGG